MNKVAILILTKDRPDFIIRQLEYYKTLKSPHPVYILDSSNKENASKIKDYIRESNVSYVWVEPGQQPFNKLLVKCHEKYVCYSGDDDYQIPDSLTECAEFLDKNPGFVSCSGQAVSIRLKGNGAYGPIERVSDYNRQEVLDNLPEDRFLNLMNNYCVHLFNVTRIETYRKMWNYLPDFRDDMVEIYPVSKLVIDGKVKVIDNLQFIRQIHGMNGGALGTKFQWLANHFKDSYAEVKNRLPIPEKIIELGFENYIRNMLNSRYSNVPVGKPKKQQLRILLTRKFPILKRIYRRHIKPTFSLEVTQEDSKYHKTFKTIEDSLWGLMKPTFDSARMDIKD